MKLLTIVVPCYNSQDYMDRCLESLLSIHDTSVELIIVNDGSTDRTAEQAEKYAQEYPEIVKVVHQENAGHGGAINTGIDHATGLYLKVVDSDDWVDIDSYSRIVNQIRTFQQSKQCIDMIICNYVYEKEGSSHKKRIHYSNVLPQDKIFSWKETKTFRRGQYLLMHSLIYKTYLLQNCHLRLPKHTFYVDNLFAFIPLDSVDTMFYINTDFYRYYIGREDQSVNEKVMIRRIDQQIRVTESMLEHMFAERKRVLKQKEYLLHYLEIIMAVTSILLIRSKKKENLYKKKNLWDRVKAKDRELYHRLRFGLLGILINLPGTVGRAISVEIYKISQKIIGFN